MLLLIGGESDPNIVLLDKVARSLGVNVESLIVGENHHPTISWNIINDTLTINHRLIKPTSVFIRHDAFSSLSDQREEVSARSASWFTTLANWVLAHPTVKCFNKNSLNGSHGKPQVLALANRLGIDIPDTVISNDIQNLTEINKTAQLVVKPVFGGGFCEEFKHACTELDLNNGASAMPAIVQERLAQPEVRIYRIGDSFYPFLMESTSLDYRVKQDCNITPLDTDKFDKNIIFLLKKLTDNLKMKFAAADYKTCPTTGELLFLEVNAQPMFTVFDKKLNGRLSTAIIKQLS